MGKDFNDKFRDCIDKINNIAKSKGWKNGKDWAAFAVKFHLISESMKIDYDKCHELRNSMSHGNAKNIIVHQATYSTAREFLKIIEAKIRENKGNKKIRKFDNTINHGKANKRRIDRGSGKIFFSNTEKEYLEGLLYEMRDFLTELYNDAPRGSDVMYDILHIMGFISDSLYLSKPGQQKQLLYILRNGLYSLAHKYSYNRVEKYADLLNTFLP